MRPIMRLILGLGALAVILLGVAFVLPQDVTIARSVVINAPGVRGLPLSQQYAWLRRLVAMGGARSATHRGLFRSGARQGREG